MVIVVNINIAVNTDVAVLARNSGALMSALLIYQPISYFDYHAELHHKFK